MAYEELVDIPCTFDPKNDKLKDVFVDDIARAVWVGYRAHHICSDRMMISLRTGSLKIAEEIKKNPGILTKNSTELGIWIGKYISERSPFTQKIFLDDGGNLTEFANFIRPYLQRKKIATIKLVSADYKVEQ